MKKTSSAKCGAESSLRLLSRFRGTTKRPLPCGRTGAVKTTANLMFDASKLVKSLRDAIIAVKISRDERMFACGGADKVGVFSCKTGNELFTVPAKAGVNAVIFSTGPEPLVLVRTFGGHEHLFDTGDGAQVHTTRPTVTPPTLPPPATNPYTTLNQPRVYNPQATPTQPSTKPYLVTLLAAWPPHLSRRQGRAVPWRERPG